MLPDQGRQPTRGTDPPRQARADRLGLLTLVHNSYTARVPSRGEGVRSAKLLVAGRVAAAHAANGAGVIVPSVTDHELVAG